jgi:uncharacterized protein with NAD-binding domain and iron-sulfur cluster
MRRKVVIIGGGVAGMTAAHELTERGFDVHLYERRSKFGGKAQSYRNRDGLPGEHGFRFFPGWYRHLPHTMSRIPYQRQKVADNLVAARESLFASYSRPPIPAILKLPRSLQDLLTLTAVPEHLRETGLSASEFLFFLRRLAEFAMKSEARRLADHEGESWWDFMEADAPGRSPQYRAYLVDGITRNTVAADPRHASAYTIATCALRTIGDAVTPNAPIDQVLNGPSDEVWLKPWTEYLTAQGVVSVYASELESIQVQGNRIQSVELSHHALTRRRLKQRFELIEQLFTTKALPADEDGTLKELLQTDWTYFEGCADALAGKDRASSNDSQYADGYNGCLTDESRRALLKKETSNYRAALNKLGKATTTVEADYFIFALPIEQMAYYIQRSEMLQRLDPSLVNIIELSNSVEWMAGIQFYLTKKDLAITPGHIDCLDSEWAITAISQTQFWSQFDVSSDIAGLRDEVYTVISVDVSSWATPGRLHRKPAYDCSPQEVAEEVWDQLCRSLNRRGEPPLLRNEYLFRYDAKRHEELPPQSFCLDPSLEDRFDRKKHAFYKRYESVRFSAQAVRERGASSENTSYFTSGKRLLFNSEPLFINRAGTRNKRPGAKTAIENMFLAGDYVQTNTDLATMEAANESARNAVNSILADCGYNGERCRVWTLAPSTDLFVDVAKLLGLSGQSNGGLIQNVAAVTAKATLQWGESLARLIAGRK